MKRFSVAAICLFFNALSHSTEMSVTTASLEQLQFFPSLTAPASVVALNQSKLAAEVTAKIERINVQVGESVSSGQVLIELDCKNMALDLKAKDAQLKQLQSQLAFDKRQLSRGAALAKKRNLGEADLDKRQTAVLTSESQVTAQQAIRDIAEAEVSRCRIMAPYDGVVLKRLVNVGEMTARGQAVVEVLQLTRRDVSAKIPLVDLRSFLDAESYELVVDEQVFPVALRALLPLVENFSSSREARLDFTGEIALSGSNGRIIWRSPMPHLPAYLLQTRNDEKGVFITDDRVVRFIQVKNAQEGRPIPFDTSKLKSKTQVVLDGRQALSDGDAIQISRRSVTSLSEEVN